MITSETMRGLRRRGMAMGLGNQWSQNNRTS